MEDLTGRLKELYGEDIRVSRIYHCKDGRKRVDLVGKNIRRTYQIARLILEAHLGRILTSGETVDHIDGDKTNDTIENLRVLSLSANAADSAIRLNPQIFECPTCYQDFELSKDKLKNAARNRRLGKTGPFCGRSCAGRYGAKVGHGQIEELPVTQVVRSYSSDKDGLVPELVDGLVLTCGTTN